MVILVLFYLVYIFFSGSPIKLFFLLLFLIKNKNLQLTRFNLSFYSLLLLFISIILNFFFNAPIDYGDYEDWKDKERSKNE